jgi:hypothetical protein
MPKHSYQLINPVIEGTFKSVYDANTPIGAAKSMWSNLSEHVIAHVPKFMFTLRDISTGQLHHFEVSENRTNKQGGAGAKGKVSFTIDSLNMNIDKKAFEDFAKKIDEYDKNVEKRSENNEEDDQMGGKRKRYDESSSSSSSSSTSTDYPVIRRTSPIAMFHYNTRVYFTENTPVFQSTLNPQLVAVSTPIFTPIFKPVLGTFIGIWP